MERPSLNEIAEILAERANKQFEAGFKEMMKTLVNIKMARVMRDTLMRNPGDREYFRVWIDIPLEKSPIYQGAGDCTTKRTVCCVPTPLRANSILFDYVGTPTRDKNFEISTSLEIVKAKVEGTVYGRTIPAAYMNGYIYVLNYTGGDMITVGMIPENLNEVRKCIDFCGVDSSEYCYSDDKPYPAPKDMVERVIRMILAEDLNRYSQNYIPVVNPVNDEITQSAPTEN